MIFFLIINVKYKLKPKEIKFGFTLHLRISKIDLKMILTNIYKLFFLTLRLKPILLIFLRLTSLLYP